ncbi:MAG: SPOR domain-containing protein [Proteobacteria bacterium]|nr:SPOR domain-containing protein [Pseudomonadota bacterium]
MISFKGILKYLIYIFIAGWMFLLGIMVGRGSSPVTFDTHEFQKRLEIIANEFGKKKDVPQKMDLKFYDVLDRPVLEESVLSKNKPLEIMPKKEISETDLPETELPETETLEKQTSVTPDIFPPKISRKKLTFKKMTQKVPADIGANEPLKTDKGIYTIQIAAYKEFKDAISQMVLLDEKGFSSYREKGEKNGVAFYRVRTGSFANWEEAEKMKEKLNKAKINAQIIKMAHKNGS